MPPSGSSRAAVSSDELVNFFEGLRGVRESFEYSFFLGYAHFNDGGMTMNFFYGDRIKNMGGVEKFCMG